MRALWWTLAWRVALLAAAACAGDGDPQTEEMSRPGRVAVPDEAPPPPAESLPMPDFPDADRGRLVAVSAGRFDLQGTWPAQAARCTDPPMLEVHGLVAGEPGVGTLVLLQMPEGDPLTAYPIVTVDEGAPEPPAAQIAVQDSRGPTVHAFQGLEGSIELSAFDGRVSGRFAVTLRELQSDELAKYVAVFHEVPLEDLPEDYCRQYRDGLMAPDSG